MEVMDHRVEEEVMAEQPPEIFLPVSRSAENGSVNGIQENGSVNGVHEKSVYLDKNEGVWKCHHCIWSYKLGNPWVDNIHQNSHILHGSIAGKSIIEGNGDISKEVTSSVTDSTQNLEDLTDKILSGLSASTSRSKEEQHEIARSNDVEEEEVIELEFERAVDKLHTHTPYCPNCNKQITKVVLRRKMLKTRAPAPAPRSSPSQPTGPSCYESLDLLGCLSCFSIFTSSGNRLKRYNIFATSGESTVTANPDEGKMTSADGPANPPVQGNADGCLSLFRIFRTNGKQTSPPSEHEPSTELPTERGKQGENEREEETSQGVSPPKPPRLPGNEGEKEESGVEIGESPQLIHDPQITPPAHKTEDPKITGPVFAARPGDAVLDVPPVSIGAGVSTSLEILKCIVYGGLMELIASLSVVSSAAASDATTLNIICIGLATMVSGLIIFGHHLIDLKNEVPQENSEQQTDRYEELLGRRGQFFLHSSFAILSFLVFGLTPPIVYGFAFRESDNKDYKIIAVAIASFACILILAAAKAYVKQIQTLGNYIKNIMYYVSLAVTVSGVAYAAGDLFKLLMERLGWFEPETTPAAGLLASDMILGTRAWGSY